MDDHYIRLFGLYAHRLPTGTMQVDDNLVIGHGWKFWMRRIGWITVHCILIGITLAAGFYLGQWLLGSPW